MAKEKGLTYVKLDGNVGILANGAGLCMSTLDVVAQAGGAPANFLDAGGGSKADAIVNALEVITSDAKVNAILFNIFGGITRCDEVAKGIVTPRSRSTSTCRWSCGWTAPTPSRAWRCCRGRDRRARGQKGRCSGAARRVVELAKGSG